VPQPARPAAPAPPAAPAEGQQTADSLRGNWDAVLEAVKRERRVAWILLGSASVHSLHEGILTLRFTRDGDLKAFNSSGHDAILKKVLSTGFGLNVTVKGVVGAGAGPVAAGPGGGRPGAVGGSGRGAGYGSAAGASGTGGFSGTGGAGRVGGTAGSGRGGEAGTGGAAAPGSPRGSTAPEPGGRHDDLSDDLPPEPDDMADDLSPDEPEPDDWSAGKRPAEERSAGAPAELTGMDLIQRELGGQVIREIEG
jgi:DNA polymerase-3 subunit gamma/tau